MKLLEHSYPEVIARCFSNALFNIFEEMEGIVCQGENEDGIMQKFIVWKEGSHVKIMETNINIPVGSFIKMHDNKEDAIIKSVLNGIDYIEI